ncbi:MAG TPA: DUF424 family protein [Candidatus Angelobacter sp.]|nr:DUF424 family protein [Candidatus Angelobacter sp.]
MDLVYATSYKTEKGSLVACCDEDCLGRTFREGRLKLAPESKFYGSAVIGLTEAVVLMVGADMLNLVGKRVVDAAINNGLVHPDAVITIAGVPHVQVMKL